METQALKQRMRISRKSKATGGLVEFARDDTAAAGDVGTGGRRRAAAHGVAIFVDPPLGVRARDEVALGIPAGDPVDAVVEKEEAQLLRAATFVQRGVEPAAAVF